MLCIFSFPSLAQGDFQDEHIFYRNEFSYVASLRSNGFGLGTRYAKRITAFNKRLFEFQVTSLHHDKEIKITPDSGLGKRLVYGKLNATYQVLLSYGTQKEKFSKLDQKSVAIRYIHLYGLAVGIEKPYYYSVNQSGTEYERFNTSNTTKYGKAPFEIGLWESKFTPGIYYCAMVNFEFHNTQKSFQAFEVGISVQAYARKLEIMYGNENTWLFPTFFINYRLGTILKD